MRTQKASPSLTQASEFSRKVGDALKKAVSDAVEEHRRSCVPLAVWQDGKVVLVTPEPASAVAEPSGQYRPNRPRRKS